MKKSQRRTPNEVLKDLQSEDDGIVNIVVFVKDDPSNKVSSRENPKEIEKYERFFTAMNGDDCKCQQAQAFTVDVMDVKDALSQELLRKLSIDGEKDFTKRTMTLVMQDGEGLKIQGPTATQKVSEYLLEQGFVSGSEDDCKNQFEDTD